MNSLYTPLLLLSLAIRVSTQTLGQDVCVCSPGAYGMTLDFSLVCPPTNITVSDPGIRDTSCLISQFGSPGATDLVPASVDRIDVLEIREDSTLILRNEITGPFSDGDTITYTTNPIDSTASIADIPFGIQFNTHAFNAAGEPLLNVLSIEYTNECDVYPVIREDQTAGWLRFTALEPPQSGLCPAAESEAPTVTASSIPTAAPATTETNPPTVLIATDAPTATPADTPLPTILPVTEAPSVTTPSPTSTEAPVTTPTDAPTEAPVTTPTDAPEATPTDAPEATPTEAPVTTPTDAPEATPTDAPVTTPTDAPGATPTEAPVTTPTEAPGATPTEAPVTTPTAAPGATPTEAPVASPTEPPADSPVPLPTPSTTPMPTTATRPTSPSTDMSMSMVMMGMGDMEDNLDAALHLFEEFGRMVDDSKSSKKSSKKYRHSTSASAPTPKSMSKKSSKRS